MRDLVEDPKDSGPRVDSAELVSNRRRTLTIARTLERGSNGIAQRLGRRFVGRKIDPDSGPCDARVDVEFVFSQSRSDKGTPKLMAWLTLPLPVAGVEAMRIFM